MNVSATIRTTLFSAALATPALAQALPPAAPTVGQTAAQAAPAQQPSHRADVQITTGQLSVNADNSSLNQILRDIGRLTGMKITGGVNDERVYGTYGPADTSTVLSALLKGTGSNMMLIFDARQEPQELVLTPRGGGPTPPNPSASRSDDRDEDDLPQRRGRMPRSMEENSPKPVPAPTPPPVPVVTAPSSAPAAAATDTAAPAPSGEPPTVQQVYEQLQKLQQQQQKANPPSTPPK